MPRKRAGLLLITLVYAGFISLGMPDGLLSVAWPSMRATFELPLDALGSLLLLFTTGYLFSSLVSGWLLQRMNIGSLLALSCLATSSSLFGYAVAPRWWILVAFGLMAGLGAGAIDAGLNTYVATFHSARTVSWLHACYGIATTSGPALLTAIMVSGKSWQYGYRLVAAGQFVLALCFGLSRRMWPTSVAPDKPKDSADHSSAKKVGLWKLPAVWLSVSIFFVYTGIETAAGAWPYSLFTESRGIPMITAGIWASAYWGCFTAGRVITGIFANRLSTRRILRFCLAGIITGLTLLWLNPSSLLSFVGVSFVGFACAPIFPVMIATTPERFNEKQVASVIGWQIAAAVLGQTFLPSLVGLLAGSIGLEVLAPTLLIATFLLLVFTEALFTTPKRDEPQSSPHSIFS